ncbi:MAG: enterochelin esterase [Proteobacteria bacterium]|nr:enterochelin esterase [Pseudomonadota bacterium]
MARKHPSFPQGRLVVLEHHSKVLKDNPLGDPSVRRVAVWLPPQYDTSAEGRKRGRRFPVLYDLVGFTGSGLAHLNWRPFDENVPERAARLVHEGRMAPAIIVFPDCFTSLGGNQYINSAAIGRYADYLTREIVPFVDREFRTLASRDHRGCFGKSSGGYGSMIHGMQYPETWGAIADHSGDALFDLCYLADWPRTLNELDKFRPKRRKAGPVDAARDARSSADGRDDGRVRRFLAAMWAKEKLSDAEIHAVMELAMAASYDPDRNAPNGFRLPFNLETGELLPKRWAKWLAHDPVNLVGRYRKNLASLRGIYIDCGWRDQYHLHFGARVLSRKLTEHGIDHVYEEFDDTHSSIDYRMDDSLPFLTRALR